MIETLASADLNSNCDRTFVGACAARPRARLISMAVAKNLVLSPEARVT